MVLKLIVFGLLLLTTGCDFLFPPGDVIGNFSFLKNNNSHIPGDIHGKIIDDTIFMVVPYTSVLVDKAFVGTFNLASNRYSTNPPSGNSFDSTKDHQISVLSGNTVTRVYTLKITADTATVNFMNLRSPFYEGEEGRVDITDYSVSSVFPNITLNLPAGVYERAIVSAVGFDEITIPVGASSDTFELERVGVELPHKQTVISPDGTRVDWTINAGRISSDAVGVSSVELVGKFEYEADRMRVFDRSDWVDWYTNTQGTLMSIPANHGVAAQLYRPILSWETSKSITTSDEYFPWGYDHNGDYYHGSWISVRNHWDNNTRATAVANKNYVETDPGFMGTTVVTRPGSVSTNLTFRNNFTIPPHPGLPIENSTENRTFTLGWSAYRTQTRVWDSNWRPTQVIVITTPATGSHSLTYQIKRVDSFVTRPKPLFFIEQIIIHLEPFTTADNFVSTGVVNSYSVDGNKIIIDVVDGYYQDNVIIFIFDVISETGNSNTFILRSQP